VTPTVVSRTATQIVVSQVFGTAASTWSVEALNGTASSGQAAFFVAAPATLAIGVGASPVTGKTAALTALNGGSNTTTKFGWSVTTKPTNATSPTFSANNTNAAKSTTITFFAAGTYTIKLTSTTGTTVKTATATVTVAQTFTSVKMTPTSATVNQSATKQFAASAVDQFGAALASQPAFTWAVDAGGVGTVSTAGLYTAPSDVTGSATVRATTGGKSATAAVTVTWPAAKINFQKTGSPTVSGYLADYGDTYNSRNGRVYGWSVSHTDSAVDRNKISNQLTDTNVGIKSGAKWELYVPKGTYSVKLSVGDSGASSKNTVVVEGTTVMSGVSLAANTFKTVTATVTVSDGRLTLTAGSAADLATRLDYVEITKVG
ncbi:MAG TPA: Ig-like domain-containing protein, partial [Humisphaera sp.]